ncbi:MAG: tetratricopeptide repeat protein, partial [Desulfobacteraceae bacterium]
MTIALSVFCLIGCSGDTDKDAESQWKEINKKTALLFQEGKYTEAIETGKNALQMAEKIFKPDNPNISTSLFNLAGIYYIQGQYDQAAPLFERALKISTHAYGPNHVNVAHILKAQANMYYVQDKFPESKDTFNRALAIYVGTYGNAHPSVPDILASLGEINKIQCKLNRAIDLYKAALQVKPNDPNLKNNLGKIEADRRDIDKLIMNFQEQIRLRPDNYL